ncbi:calcium-binding protein, partial [Xanthobacter sp. TB0139]|uniref:calcium-binding protein n=1 Tax=Xanthobacter sp. TB0139 TaxID=3459178 RepID=UPI004039A4DF
KTVNVNGPLAQGLEVDYDGEKRADLTLNVSANIGNVGNGSSVRVLEASSLAVQFQGASILNSSIQVDEDTTQTVSIVNQSVGDAVVNGDGLFRGTAIEDGHSIRTLTIATENSGDLTVGGVAMDLPPVDALANANSLQTLNVSAASNGDIMLGLIGDHHGGEADDLETVSIQAADYADITSYGIDADETDGAGNNAADISRIDIVGGTETRIGLFGAEQDLEVDGHSNVVLPEVITQAWVPPVIFQGHVIVPGYFVNDERTSYDIDTFGHNWLQAGSVGAMNITTAGEVVGAVSEVATQEVAHWTGNIGPVGGHWGTPTVAFVHVFNDLVGLDLEAPSTGTLNVSGTGSVNGFFFEDEVVKTLDASGLAGGDAGTVTTDGFAAYLGTDVADELGVIGRDYGFAVLTTEEASSGFTVLGSQDANYVVGTNSADSLTGASLSDLLIGNGGRDNLMGDAGNDILFGDNTGAELAREIAFGNDTIDGGAGNDIIIGGGQAAGGQDTMTGGTGDDTFVFRLGEEFVGLNSETGKSSVGSAVSNDIITDFGNGNDVLVFDVDAPELTGVDLYFEGEWHTEIGAFGPANVVVRQGTYADGGEGTFQVSATGSDYQVLLMNNGQYFGVPSGNGQNLFNDADHEIALLGAADGSGSISADNFVFV